MLQLFIAENADLRVLTLPDELDPADFLLERGPEQFAALMERCPDALEHKYRTLAARCGGVPTLPGELQDDVTAAWARLQAASEQFAVALAHARAQPIDVQRMASLVMAHEALRTAWGATLAEAVPADAVPSSERLQARWLRLLHQSLPLRTAFNDAAQSYNQAIAQFPASLLARLFGFKPAGTVTRLADGR